MKSPHAARQIGNTHGSISGVFPFRGKRLIPYESTLERDFLIKASWSDTILDIQEQPLIIPYKTATGRESTYTPDFLVYYRTTSLGATPKSLLVEVKPKMKLDKEFKTLRLKFKAGIGYAKKQGWRYTIYHESRIRDATLNNIAFLQRFHNMSFNDSDTQYLLNALSEMGHCTMDSFLAIMYSRPMERAQAQALIWHLIATKKLACPMHEPLNSHIPIWLNTDPGYLPTNNNDDDEFYPSEVNNDYE
jgi:hypothetical protein